MLPIVIGVVLIVLGLCLLPIGCSDFKQDLKMVNGETSGVKRLFVYLITFIGLFDFSSYLGWILSLGLVFVFSGGAFILLTIWQ